MSSLVDTSARRHCLFPLGEAMIRVYHGNSMEGTLQAGDRLAIQPMLISNIRVGDIVAYRLPGGRDRTHEIVHRVVAMVSGGLVTRGDNSPKTDTGLVTTRNLLGKVTHVERDGVIRPVHGGRMGLWCARLFRAGQCLCHLGRAPYHWLRSSGVVRVLWKPVITQVHIANSSGSVVKYICRGSTVARWWPEEGRFECRKPYDLVVSPPDGAT